MNYKELIEKVIALPKPNMFVPKNENDAKVLEFMVALGAIKKSPNPRD